MINDNGVREYSRNRNSNVQQITIFLSIGFVCIDLQNHAIKYPRNCNFFSQSKKMIPSKINESTVSQNTELSFQSENM